MATKGKTKSGSASETVKYNPEDLCFIGLAGRAAQNLINGEALAGAREMYIEICDSSSSYKVGALILNDGFVDVDLDGYGDVR